MIKYLDTSTLIKYTSGNNKQDSYQPKNLANLIKRNISKISAFQQIVLLGKLTVL